MRCVRVTGGALVVVMWGQILPALASALLDFGAGACLLVDCMFNFAQKISTPDTKGTT
jgi:hypothetical protein